MAQIENSDRNSQCRSDKELLVSAGSSTMTAAAAVLAGSVVGAPAGAGAAGGIGCDSSSAIAALPEKAATFMIGSSVTAISRGIRIAQLISKFRRKVEIRVRKSPDNPRTGLR